MRKTSCRQRWKEAGEGEKEGEEGGEKERPVVAKGGNGALDFRGIFWLQPSWH